LAGVDGWKKAVKGEGKEKEEKGRSLLSGIFTHFRIFSRIFVVSTMNWSAASKHKT